MNNKLYTPGPWLQEPEQWGPHGEYFEPSVRTVEDANGRSSMIATVRVGLEGSKANVQLIAAAPDLLECGKKLCNEVAGMIGAAELRALLGNTNFAVLFQRFEEMRAAIAKATDTT